MQIRFRDTVQPSDAAAVRRLTESTGFFRPDEVDVAVELVEERLAKGVGSEYFFWIAEAEDGMIGYVCYGPVPCTLGSYDLYWIVVDQRRQRHGLGKQLASMAENSAKQMGGQRIYVETAGKKQYAPSRKFYEKAGYRLAAELPDFYEPGDAKLIYQKNLT